MPKIWRINYTLTLMIIEFEGNVWYWRGPAPYYFVTVPKEPSEAMEAISTEVSYGWGMIPVVARVGETEWKTSLFPKDGQYIVPLKDSVRQAEEINEGDTIRIKLHVRG
jgi:hypothetical protein